MPLTIDHLTSCAQEVVFAVPVHLGASSQLQSDSLLQNMAASAPQQHNCVHHVTWRQGPG